jgi:hypothetical protein
VAWFPRKTWARILALRGIAFFQYFFVVERTDEDVILSYYGAMQDDWNALITQVSGAYCFNSAVRASGAELGK